MAKLVGPISHAYFPAALDEAAWKKLEQAGNITLSEQHRAELLEAADEYRATIGEPAFRPAKVRLGMAKLEATLKGAQLELSNLLLDQPLSRTRLGLLQGAGTAKGAYASRQDIAALRDKLHGLAAVVSAALGKLPTRGDDGPSGNRRLGVFIRKACAIFIEAGGDKRVSNRDSKGSHVGQFLDAACRIAGVSHPPSEEALLKHARPSRT